MNISGLTDEISKIGAKDRLLDLHEKQEILELVAELSQRAGLGAALSALWEQQKGIGFILGNPTGPDEENLTDTNRFLAKKAGPYWLIHSDARKDRANRPFLKRSGIESENARFVYEKLEECCYSHHPTECHGFREICRLCSAERANPNEVLVPVELADSEFIYGANYATLGHSHFTLWTRVPILQQYWKVDSLAWLCAHGDKLVSPEFTTFYNGLGAGNSIKHFHYQTLREHFPIFDAPTDHIMNGTGVVRLVWPLPAYKLTLKAGCDRSQTLEAFDKVISRWLEDPLHSLNLAHRTDLQGDSHIIFVPRVKEKTIPVRTKISNAFGGCEVCGRINVEDRSEWEKVVDKAGILVGEMLVDIAPGAVPVKLLEDFMRY